MTRVPLVKYLILVLIGLSFSLISNIIILSLVILVINVFVYIGFTKQYVPMRQITFIVFTTLTGYIVGFGILKPVFTTHIYQPKLNALIHGRIHEINITSNNTLRIKVEGNIDFVSLKNIQAKCLLSLPSQDSSVHLQPGNEIYCVAQLRLPEKQQLPTDFPEVQFCTANGVMFLGSIFVNEFAVTSEQTTWYANIQRVRTSIQKFNDVHYSKETKGIINALVIGETNEVDNTTRELFSLTGTSHVLSVSGLHVGVIAYILYLLFGFVHHQWLRVLLFSCCLISFVVLTGFQPSAVRAVIMAIVVVVVKTMQRDMSTVNILVATSTLMLFLEPSLLFSIAFQLSVTSLLGLLLFYQRSLHLLKLIFPWNNIVFIWLLNSVAVSIAASILVLPLVTYYFSSLSLIGPISNIIAVPLTSLAMVLGILAYLVHPFTTVLAEGYILLAQYLLQITITVNSFLLSLPYSSIQNLQIVVPVIVTSCCIGYIVHSSTIRMLVLRVGISSIIMVAIIVSLPEQSTYFTIQHKHIRASFIKSTNNASVLLLHDIRPVKTIYYDKSLTQYLNMQTTDSILVVSKGRQSEIVCDSLLSNPHCKNIKYVKL